MIWGDFIRLLRELHEEMFSYLKIPHSAAEADVTLDASAFPFPRSRNDFSDEEWFGHDLELHPVERVLLEGPLLPIERVELTAEAMQALHQAILALEKDWLTQTRRLNAESEKFLESTLQTKWARLRPPSVPRLRAVS